MKWYIIIVITRKKQLCLTMVILNSRTIEKLVVLGFPIEFELELLKSMVSRKENDFLANYFDVTSIKQVNCCGKFEKRTF